MFTSPPSRFAIAVALAAIYLIWGSTYLAIAVALEGLPPFLLGAVRFVAAGVLLGLWPVLRGHRPTGRQLASAAVLGVLLVAGGNGAVNWASQWVASGTAALVSAITPCFIVGLELLGGRGRRPNVATSLGLACGIVATLLLVDPFARVATGPNPVAIAVLLCGALSWAIGSILSRRVDLPSSSALATSLQLIFGGAVLGIVGFASGEATRVDVSVFTSTSAPLWAMVYLVVFGSVIGYGSYCWLLRSAPLPLVATHSYVNPLVAVGLGWLLLGETISPVTLCAGALTLFGVLLISRGGGPRAIQGPSAAHSGVPAEQIAEDAAADLLEPEWLSIADGYRAASSGPSDLAAILESVAAPSSAR